MQNEQMHLGHAGRLSCGTATSTSVSASSSPKAAAAAGRAPRWSCPCAWAASDDDLVRAAFAPASTAAARRPAGPGPAPAWRRPVVRIGVASAPRRHRRPGPAQPAAGDHVRSGRRRRRQVRASAAPAALPATIILPPPVMAASSAAGIGNRPRQYLGSLVLEVSAVEELLLDALFKHGRGSYGTTAAQQLGGRLRLLRPLAAMAPRLSVVVGRPWQAVRLRREWIGPESPTVQLRRNPCKDDTCC